MDGLDLQRLITALLMPLPLGLLLAGAGLILLAASRWRRGGWWRGGWLLAVSGLATLLLAALPGVSRTLMADLERPYPPRPAAECPRAGAIVLLGGALQPLLAGEARGRLHRGSDRAWEAARQDERPRTGPSATKISPTGGKSHRGPPARPRIRSDQPPHRPPGTVLLAIMSIR